MNLDLGPLQRRLATRRELARLTILFERIWPAVWPATGLAGLFVLLALLDLPRPLPPIAHFVYVVAFGAGFVLLLLRGLRGIAAPRDDEADRRLERDSGLRHRPLSALTDRPSATDETGMALWQAHVLRAVAQVRRVRVGLPHPGLARLDRRALRGGLAVGLVAALGIAGTDAPDRLLAALQPTLPRAAMAATTQLQAWITPPSYTKLPPVFLKPEVTSVSVPAGSRLTVSVTGGSGAPALVLNGQTTEFRQLDQGSFQADQKLGSGGHLAVRRDGAEIGGWELTVVADQHPTAAWAEAPGPAASDPQQLRLPWRVTDDYGVTGLQAELRLRDRPDAPPVVVSVPLPGGEPKNAKGADQRDLTAHPWAGLPVTGQLVARDALGQTGASADAAFVLPERPFRNPVARALIAIRKGLSLHPDNRDEAVGGLDALMVTPEAFGQDYAAYLNLTGIYYLLVRDQSAGVVPKAQDRLWELALHMEEGSLDRTARALEQARQAAKDALEKATREPTDANRQALEQKLKELERAIQERMQALMEEMRRNGQEMQADENSRRLSSQDMQKLAEQAREAAKQGDMKTAQERMAELEQMLDALRNGRAMTAQEMQNARQRQKGQKQMSAVQDMIGREGGLLDRSQQRSPSSPPSPQQQRSQQQDGQPAGSDEATQQQADQRVQQALRRALGELMQQFGDLTGKIPPSLGEADQAMRDATQALGQGKDKEAGDAQQRAIAALQKGGQQMSQQMAQQFGSGRQQGQEGEQDGPGGPMALQDGPDNGPGSGPLPGRAGHRDPFGRRYGQGHNGADETSQVTVPDQAQRQRAQEIEQQLRERGADKTRPQQELDYIDRLLKQF